MSETNWTLRHINYELETRQKPGDENKYEMRKHQIIERYKITTEEFSDATGDSTDGVITYYVGPTERTAGPLTGGKLVCTSSAAEYSTSGPPWRNVVETWESWGLWESMDDAMPAG